MSGEAEPVWKELRADFPAAESCVYLNAAAASPTPRQVTEAATGFYRDLEQGGDRAWDDWLARVEEIRVRVAAFINAEPDEIAFVANTSSGINLIADLLAPAGQILAAEMEFPTVTLPFIHRGVAVNFVPAIEGVPRVESFSPEYAPRATTIALSHVQFTNGCRQDLGAFGAAKGHRHFVVCGSQSLGAFPIDVKRAGIDALATAGHKWMCAGYGAGFVYISRHLLEKHPPRAIGWLSVREPFSFNNRQVRLLPSNRRVEMGCPAFAPIFALGAAVDYLRGIGVANIMERVLYLNEFLTFRLQRKGLNVLSPGGGHRSGQTLVEVADPERCCNVLREQGILVTPKPEGIRLSTHFYNSEEDIEKAVHALHACAAS